MSIEHIEQDVYTRLEQAIRLTLARLEQPNVALAAKDPLNVLENPVALMRIILEQNGFPSKQSASRRFSRTESTGESSSEGGYFSDTFSEGESSSDGSASYEVSSEAFLSNEFIDENFLKSYDPSNSLDAKRYELILLRKNIDALPGLMAEDDVDAQKACLQEMLDCISAIRAIDQVQFEHRVLADGKHASLAEKCSAFGIFTSTQATKTSEQLNASPYTHIVTKELKNSANKAKSDQEELKTSFVNDIQRTHNSGTLTINGKPLPIPQKVALDYDQWLEVLTKCGFCPSQLQTLVASLSQKSKLNLISLFGNAVEGQLAESEGITETYGFLKLQIEDQLDISISLDQGELIFTQKGGVTFQSPPSSTCRNETTQAKAEFNLEVKLNCSSAETTSENSIDNIQLNINNLVNVEEAAEHNCAEMIRVALEPVPAAQNQRGLGA